MAGLGLGASQLELEYGGGLGGATSWVDTKVVLKYAIFEFCN